jgi:hypothetical protein
MRVEDVISALRGVQVNVIDERLPPDRKRQYYGAVAALCSDGVEQANVVRWHHVVQALAVVRNKRIPVDEAADFIGNSVADASYYHPTITMADQDDVPEIILIYIVND